MGYCKELIFSVGEKESDLLLSVVYTFYGSIGRWSNCYRIFRCGMCVTTGHFFLCTSSLMQIQRCVSLLSKIASMRISWSWWNITRW